jgi:hypothetical protein
MQRAIRTALLTAGTTKVCYYLAEHKKKYFFEDCYAKKKRLLREYQIK